MMKIRGLPSLVLGSLLSVAAADPAGGQDALGSGRVLDANSAFGSGGNNPIPGRGDFRRRNLLITGNVAGGRGFRGTVGYTAEYDFRGELGSDDLFAFRAESAYSNPSVITAGRTFERLRFGQHLGVIEFRRAGHAASLPGLSERRFVPGAQVDDRIRTDQLVLSSTTSLLRESASEAAVVGMVRDEENRPVVATASSVLGLQLSPMQARGQFLGLSSFDLARTRQDIEAGRKVATLGVPFEAGFQDLLPPALRGEPRAPAGQIEPTMPQNRIESGFEPGYRSILERIAERHAVAEGGEPAAGQETLTDLGERFDRLREHLLTAEEPTASAPAKPAGETPGRPGEPVVGEPTRMSVADFGVVLRHDEQLERLASEDQGRFNELMVSAEELLRAGEYFKAERRFVRALRFTPGHPLAIAGMGHAQIGAGLYLPAALILRRLLTHHPEMIDVRYGPELLPERVRLNIAVRTVREGMRREQRDRASYAFLLAYIGHQLGDQSLIVEGLNVMAEVSPDDPLLELVDVVWLGEDAGEEEGHEVTK
ncbi:MAG: hypothetical protein ACYS0G_07275 [Planctomycetota bacterium]|jgi:hypothetical protein